MATFRKIHVKFWSDPYIQSLSPEQKYFFLYLLTNEKTRQCGIYEISKRHISYDTGYNIDTVSVLLKYFSDADKIMFSEATNEIAIKNWHKYNDNPSPKVQTLVKQEVSTIKNTSLIQYLYPTDTVSILNPQEEEERVKEKEEEKEQQKLPLIQKMIKVWVENNPNYKVSDKDRVAIRYIAVFISGRKGLEHLTEIETNTLIDTWLKWCFYIMQSKMKNFSLEKISRFYANEINQELLNPSHGIPNQSTIGKTFIADKF